MIKTNCTSPDNSLNVRPRPETKQVNERQWPNHRSTQAQRRRRWACVDLWLGQGLVWECGSTTSTRHPPTELSSQVLRTTAECFHQDKLDLVVSPSRPLGRPAQPIAISLSTCLSELKGASTQRRIDAGPWPGTLGLLAGPGDNIQKGDLGLCTYAKLHGVLRGRPLFYLFRFYENWTCRM